MTNDVFWNDDNHPVNNANFPLIISSVVPDGIEVQTVALIFFYISHCLSN